MKNPTFLICPRCRGRNTLKQLQPGKPHWICSECRSYFSDDYVKGYQAGSTAIEHLYSSAQKSLLASMGKSQKQVIELTCILWALIYSLPGQKTKIPVHFIKKAEDEKAHIEHLPMDKFGYVVLKAFLLTPEQFKEKLLKAMGNSNN